MQWLKIILKWRVVRFLTIWNRAPIRAQGGVLALIPIIAVIVSFIVAIYGNRSRAWIEADIQRRFKLVRQYNELTNLMINAETGERGYLLTRRREFLEPYQTAVEQIQPQIDALEQTIQAEPGDEPRAERMASLAIIKQLISRQLEQLRISQEFINSGKSGDELYRHLNEGKTTMDSIRANLNEMQSRDAELLTDRITEINAIRYRDYFFVFITLFVGLTMRLISFYLFDRGIVRRINRLTENAAALGNGERLPYLPTKKTDAVGLLEQEIAKMAERKNLSAQKEQ